MRRGVNAMADKKKKKKEQDPGIDRAWLTALKTGEIKRLYIFHGPETFRRDAALEILKKRIVEPGTEEFSYLKLDGKLIERDTIDEAVDSPCFMSERKLVVVSDYDLFPPKRKKKTGDEDSEEEQAGEEESRTEEEPGAGTKAAWAEALVKRLPDDICLVFVYDTIGFGPDTRTRLYKACRECGEIASFQTANERELREWVAQMFKKRRKTISGPDIQYLTFRCGSLMQNLASEIGKLCDYCESEQVTRDDIEAVTVLVPEAEAFALGNALSAGDLRGALSALEDVEAMRTPALMTLGGIQKQIRQMYTARLCLDRGLGEDVTASVMHIQAYPAQLATAAARRLEIGGLRKALGMCLEADLQLKSGKTDEYGVLRDLLVAMHQAMHGTERNRRKNT